MAGGVSPKVARSLSCGAAAAAFLAAISGTTQESGLVLAGQAVVLLVCFVVLLRWFERLHLVVCGLSVLIALVAPSALVPLVVGLIVVAAGLQLVADRGRDVEWKQLRPTAIASLAACALVMALAGATIGPFTPNGGGSGSAGAGPTLQPETAPDNGNALSRFLGRVASTVAEWLGMTGGEGGTGEGGVTPHGVQPPEPERDINWTRVLLAAVVLALVSFALWWLWKRLRSRPIEVDGSGNWAVRSFDATGQRVARPRRVAEDPASYGGDIDSTDDGRLVAAGHLVSAHVYRPPGAAAPPAEARELRRTLELLDDLPSAPRPPRRRPERRQIVVAIVLLAFAAFAVHSIWRGPFWMDEGPTASMLTAPATGADGYRWVLCALESGDGTPQYGGESRGFVDRSSSLIASEAFLASGGRIFVDDGGGSLLGAGVGNRDSDWSVVSEEVRPGLVGMSHLRSVVGVIDAFGLDGDGDVLVGVDGVMHHSWEKANPVSGQSAPVGFGLAGQIFNRPLYSSAHRVEAWLTREGVVMRVRVTFQEFEQTSIELRFEDSVPVVQDPVERRSLNLYGDCPQSQEDAVETGWLGFEPYEATVRTVANVAVDSEGRAYDVDYAYVVDPIASTPVGTMVFDEGTATIHDAYELLYGGRSGLDVDLESETPVAMSVSRLDTVSDHSVGVGLRFDRDEQEVEQWEIVSDECAFYTSVAVGTSTVATWPSLDEEALYGAWFDPSVETVGDHSWVGYSGEVDACLDVYVGLRDGRVQSILLRNNGIPWRLAVPDGEPPAEVREAERRLQACVDGDVLVGPFGSCPA